MRAHRFVLVSTLAACAHDTTSATPCSVDGVTGTIPGVSLTVRGDTCLFDRGQSAVFVYEVTTDASVPAIQLHGSSGCGSCQAPATDPLSWVTWSIGGDDQRYCLCDTGCCPPDTDRTVQPGAARQSAIIAWSGHTWDGPSDTGNPEGAAFVAGHYNVSVVFDGRDAGRVIANLPIEIR